MSNEYSIQIGNITREQWAQILLKFEDANIFQTWGYGVIKWGEKKLEHITLKKSNKIVAATQLWYVKFPIIGSGIAHVSWGPMWRLKGKDLDFNNLRNMIKALYKEFVIRRGFLLRIRPFEIENTSVGKKVQHIFENESLKQTNEAPYHNVILNLSPELDDLRGNLRKSWRRQLKKAESQNIRIVEGTDDDMLNSLCKIYQDMVNRKKFCIHIENLENLKKIQKELHQNFKMRIFLCQHKGKVVSGQAVAALGNTAMGIISATSNEDIRLKLSSTYLFDWETIKKMKEEGFLYYDLRGYDPAKWAGPSYYKAGFGGNIVTYLSSFEACDNSLSFIIVKIAKSIVYIIDNLMVKVRKMRNIFSNKVKLNKSITVLLPGCFRIDDFASFIVNSTIESFI